MVTQIPMRAYRSASRKIEDIRVNAYERHDNHDNSRRTADIRRDRMSVSPNFTGSVTQTQDWICGMNLSQSGRFQVVEEKKQRQRVISRNGIRNDAARVLLALLLAILIIVTLVDLAGIGTCDRRVRKLENKVASVTEKNENLENELLLCTGDVSVCTEAVRLNLVSSGGTRTVKLTVPESANMTLNSATVTDDAELDANRVASILIH